MSLGRASLGGKPSGRKEICTTPEGTPRWWTWLPSSHRKRVILGEFTRERDGRYADRARRTSTRGRGRDSDESLAEEALSLGLTSYKRNTQHLFITLINPQHSTPSSHQTKSPLSAPPTTSSHPSAYPQAQNPPSTPPSSSRLSPPQNNYNLPPP